MTRVLILAHCGPGILTVARSCRRQGVELHLLHVSRGKNRCRSCSVGATDVAIFSPDLIGTPPGIDTLAKHAARIGATALIAFCDNELVWLAEHRQAFEPSCKVLVQSSVSLSQLLSKCYQLEIARKVGFQVLPTFLLVEAGDADRVPDSAFPLVLRPNCAEDVKPYFKVRLTKSRVQLQDFLQELQFVRSPIIAQPFMDLPNLIIHGVRSTDGRVLASRSYFVSHKFEGVSLSIEPHPLPEQMEHMCLEFVRQAGVTGCYHFEFLFSPEKKLAYFLEINIRMSGITDKVTKLGFDEPSLLLQAYRAIPHAPMFQETNRSRVVNKRTLLRHILWAARGKLTELDYPSVSPLRHILYSCRDLLLAKDSVFDWRDLRGSFWVHLGQR
ncbi:MAG: hypothetical protein ABSF90_26915 [Syntrophobacteraceae bacterium]